MEEKDIIVEEETTEVNEEENQAEELPEGSNVEVSIPEVSESETDEEDPEKITIKPNEETLKTAEEITGLTEEELMDPQKLAVNQALIDMGIKITDEDSKVFTDVVIRYRLKEKNLNPYKEFPESVKSVIRNVAMKSGAGANRYKQISEVFLDEFIQHSNLNESLNKFEREVDAIYDIPAFSDLQLETVKIAFTKNILTEIDRIKEKDPDKAELLEKISKSFMNTVNCDNIINIYDTKAGCKRYVRRFTDDDNFKKEISNIEFRADKSIFEHIDAMEYYEAVKKIITDEVKLYDTSIDIDNIKPEPTDGLSRFDEATHKIYRIDPETKEETEFVDLSDIYEDQKEILATENEKDAIKTEDIKVDREKVNELLSKYKDVKFTDLDAKKFVLLMVKVFEEYDPMDVVSSTYVHYCMRNVITAAISDQKRTEFVAQLINSIKDTVMHIRSEEEKFHAEEESRKQRTKKAN